MATRIINFDRIEISGADINRNVTPNPAGMILGRSAQCEIELPGEQVSRRHARLYCDPNEQWRIEDLGSRNGLWLNGEKIDAGTLTAGDRLVIGPYSLRLAVKATKVAPSPPSDETGTTLVDDGSAGDRDITIEEDEEIPAAQSLTRDGISRLTDIGDRLSALSASADIYPSLCSEFVRTDNAMALVLRVPPGGGDLARPPETLAAESSRRRFDPMDAGDAGQKRMPVPLSRRVLGAVRSGRAAVSAGSTGIGMGLTVVNIDDPRVVRCAKISEEDDAIDLLYVDLPAPAAGDCPLGLVREAARQAHLTAKNLLYAEARSAMAAMEQELDRAREIQDKLTPREIERPAGIDAALHYRPASWVGGDYCDIWITGDGRSAFVVADVSGHGMDAAMIMANLQAALRITMTFCPEPGDVMCRLNEHLLRFSPSGRFATMVLGCLDPASGELVYVNAGHEPPFVFNSGDGTRRLEGAGNPLLGVVGHEYVAERHTLPGGTGLMVFTDGFTETFSPGGREFGVEGVAATLARGGWKNSREAVGATVAAAERHRGDLPQRDDMTALAIMRAD